MARPKVEITDKQWTKIKPLLPKPKRRTGRPRADDRRVLEGIIWVLRSGARWRDLPESYPSPSTCWRRLNQWEDEGVWEDIWRAFLTALDQRGRIRWDEFFADAAFVPAKRGPGVGPTKRGKGTKLVVVASRSGVPLGIHLDAASPAEVKMLEPVLADVKLRRRGRPVAPSARHCRSRLRRRLAALEVGASGHRDDLSASSRAGEAFAAGWPGTATIPAAVDHRANHRMADELPPRGHASRSQPQDIQGFRSCGMYAHCVTTVLKPVLAFICLIQSFSLSSGLYGLPATLLGLWALWILYAGQALTKKGCAVVSRAI